MQKLSFRIIITSFFYFLSIISATLLMNGCCKSTTSCGCGESFNNVPLFFRVKGMNGTIESYSANTQTNINSLYIELKSVPEFYSNIYLKQKNGYLMACSPNIIPTISKEKITSLTIKSNAKFSSNFDANSDLGSIVNIYMTDMRENNYYKSFNNIPSYLQTNPTAPYKFQLRFNESPTIDKKHIFTIRYEQDNGEVYTYTTPEITFI